MRGPGIDRAVSSSPQKLVYIVPNKLVAYGAASWTKFAKEKAVPGHCVNSIVAPGKNHSAVSARGSIVAMSDNVEIARK